MIEKATGRLSEIRWRNALMKNYVCTCTVLYQTSVKPVDVDCISLIEEVTLMGYSNNAFWSLFSVKTVPLQMFRPMQLVVLVAKGIIGFDCLIEEVTLTGGL